jgi:DNA-directed RNA polymerase specialized sigma24 family protein
LCVGNRSQLQAEHRENRESTPPSSYTVTILKRTAYTHHSSSKRENLPTQVISDRTDAKLDRYVTPTSGLPTFIAIVTIWSDNC